MDMNLSKLWEIVEDKGAWWATIHGVTKKSWTKLSYQTTTIISSVQSRLTLCDPMDCNTPGFPVHHQLPELAQIHVHQVKDVIQLFFAFLEFNKNLFCPIIL